MTTKIIEEVEKIVFCTHCEVWTVMCSGCGMGGCSGGHLYSCKNQKQSDELDNALQLLLSKTNLKSLLAA